MDSTILNWANQTLAHPALDALFLALTWIGNPIYHIPVLTVMLLIKRWRRTTLPLWATYIITLGLTLFFQELIGRQRPDPALVRLIMPQPEFFSYPSGHTSTMFAAAVLMTLLARRTWVTMACALWAVGVAFSRLYLGHHYPSDVLGGVLLGVCCGLAGYGLFAPAKRSLPWIRRISALLWVQLGIAFLATHIAYMGMLPLEILRWPFADKILHALLIGGVAFWLNLLLRGRAIELGRLALPIAIVLPFAVALVEEFFQAASPVRTFDLIDVLFDLIGLIVAWWLSHRLLRQSAQRQIATVATA